MSTVQIFLYSRDDCDLCDQALAMLQAEINASVSPTNQAQWAVTKVDIATDSALSEKFGWHIPVLERADTNALLYWPFPASRLREYLAVSH
jgi:hypothetical protein